MLEVGKAVTLSSSGSDKSCFYDAPVLVLQQERRSLAFMVGSATNDPLLPRLKFLLFHGNINACGLGLATNLSNNYADHAGPMMTAEPSAMNNAETQGCFGP